MFRSLLMATTFAALSFILVPYSQAQFQIRLGGGKHSFQGGHQIWKYHSPSRNQSSKWQSGHGNRGHTATQHGNYQQPVIRQAVPEQKPANLEQPPKPWDDAEHVVRIDDGKHSGAYYEKQGKAYFASEQGTTKLVSHGGFEQVDDLAARLETLTNELCLDLHHNYRHNTGFRYTYRDVYDVYQLAKYIHGLQKDGNQTNIARRLEGLDRLFHFVRDDVRTWTPEPIRRVGDLDANAKIDRIESLIHHLMNDVGVELADNPVEPPAPENLVTLPPLPEDLE